MKSRFHVFKDMFLIKKIKIIILTHTIKIIFYLFIYFAWKLQMIWKMEKKKVI